MYWFSKKFSRRDLLKGVLFAGGAYLLHPFLSVAAQSIDFPDAERLGRVCVGKVDIRKHPSVNAESTGVLYEDAIVVWLREVVGEIPGGRISARWVETPDGYIYAPSLQPVGNTINSPVSELPMSSLGHGMWVEVTTPFVDLYQENPPPRSPSLKETLYPRLYYSQIIWADDMRVGQDGRVRYRLNERFGYGDIFWADAAAMRPLSENELAPISPDVENKKLLIDVTPKRQLLTAYEDDREVYFCQISSGAKWNSAGEFVEEWGTPVGPHPIWRKLISVHMSGGSTGGGYDLAGIGWTCLFTGAGVAIHSTFWHNDYGTPRSHGCINAAPDDAKWVFRWTNPHVSMDPGDISISMPGGTIIDVKEL